MFGRLPHWSLLYPHTSNAGYAMTDADSSAGGADHSGQADAEKSNMDWAVHEEKQADYYADDPGTSDV